MPSIHILYQSFLEFMKLNCYWNRFASHFQKEAKLFLSLFGVLTLIRVVLLITFYTYIVQDSSAKDIFNCIIVGAKFDCRYVLLGITPLLILGLCFSFNDSWSKRLNAIRLGWGWFVMTLTIIIGVINVGFFFEYRDQFNHWIFGLLHDDLRAILLTIWHEYPIVSISAGIALSSYLIFVLLKRGLSQPFVNFAFLDSSRFAWSFKIALTLLMLFLVKCASTLTWGWRSLRTADTRITNNVLLNRLVCNSYFSLYNAIKQQNRCKNRLTGLATFLPDRNLNKALHKIFPHQTQSSSNIDDWIEHTVKKASALNPIPEHIFLIIMESQDNWPLQDHYSDIAIAPNLREFKAQGIYIPAFLSAGENTIAALSTIITGIPEVGLSSEYDSLARHPLSSSIAKPFKELGYATNFFYGGRLTWQDIGNLALNQKFDHIYGCESITYTTPGNEWGADDADFMNSIVDKLKNATQPTFNLIMTTSNHDPHTIDLEKEGCPLQEIESAIQARGWKQRSSTVKLLGHSWYGDKCVGNFVKTIEKQYPTSLFAITGDHYCRHYLHDKQTRFEGRTVPFILYGPEVLKTITISHQSAGSHIDIVPTLIELIAPTGFTYWSMGSNLLDPNASHIGLGANSLIHPSYIFDIARGNGLESLPWNTKPINKTPDDLKDLYNAFHGIGWWRMMQEVIKLDES